MTKYQLRLDADGWHIHAPFLPIEVQLLSFNTRKRALMAITHICFEHRAYV